MQHLQWQRQVQHSPYRWSQWIWVTDTSFLRTEEIWVVSIKGIGCSIAIQTQGRVVVLGVGQEAWLTTTFSRNPSRSLNHLSGQVRLKMLRSSSVTKMITFAVPTLDTILLSKINACVSIFKHSTNWSSARA